MPQAALPFASRFFELRDRVCNGRFDTSLPARRARLRRLQRALLDARPDVERALAEDLGKAPEETTLSEVLPVVAEAGQAIRRLPRWSAPRPVGTPLLFAGTRGEVRWEPKGVVAILAPWNFPVTLTLGPLVSALAAGNAAVVKPSELAPATADWLAAWIERVFPEGDATVVRGDADVARALLDLPFDHVFFTGSTDVGRKVMARAARHPTPVTLELGGKSPAWIHDSADLEDAAAKIAFGKFLNAGQTCIAPDYALVPASLVEPFVVALEGAVRERWPDPAARDFTRLVSSGHAERLASMLTEAIAGGTRVAFGGSVDVEARFVAPTALVDPCGRVLDDEIFGPLLPIVPYADESEAVAFVRARPTPLASYAFSRDAAAARRWVAGVRSGTAMIDGTLQQFLHPSLPFGGLHESGLGRGHGEWGFRTFSHARAVLRQRRGFTPARWLQPPYGARARRWLERALRWVR